MTHLEGGRLVDDPELRAYPIHDGWSVGWFRWEKVREGWELLPLDSTERFPVFSTREDAEAEVVARMLVRVAARAR